MMITEEIRIEGIDLDGSPPYEIMWPGKEVVLCGRPAAFRLVYTCSCGRIISFACGSCREKLLMTGTLHYQGNHDAYPAGEW